MLSFVLWLVRAAAAASLLGGIWLLLRNLRFTRSAERAEATVLETSFDSDSIGYPKVAFKTRKGEEVVFESRFGTNVGLPKDGAKVGVYYDPAAPQNAKLDLSTLLWFPPALMILCGAVFLAALWGNLE